MRFRSGKKCMKAAFFLTRNRNIRNITKLFCVWRISSFSPAERQRFGSLDFTFMDYIPFGSRSGENPTFCWGFQAKINLKMRFAKKRPWHHFLIQVVIRGYFLATIFSGGVYPRLEKILTKIVIDYFRNACRNKQVSLQRLEQGFFLKGLVLLGRPLQGLVHNSDKVLLK